MPVTNKESGTNVNEIDEGIYRISTPVPPDLIPGGFTFNQYLIVDDEPLLFETGLRRMFPLVRDGRERDTGRAVALHLLLPRRGRRMRLAQRMAGRRSQRCAAMRTARGDDPNRGPCRPVAALDGRRRDGFAWRAFGEMARRTACAACMGLRLHFRGTYRDTAMQRSLHPARRESAAAYRVGHSGPKRIAAQPSRLLRARHEHSLDPGKARADESAHTRLYAWERMAGRRCGAHPGACRRAYPLTLANRPSQNRFLSTPKRV